MFVSAYFAPRRFQLARNGDFERVPPFTAATTTAARWIDGTAAGSTTNDFYRWAQRTDTGTTAVQFDSTEYHSGNSSLKLSVTATGSRIDVSNIASVTVANLPQTIKVLPNVSYTLAYWMKTNVVSGDSSDGGYMRLIQRDVAAATGTTTSGTKIKTTTDWTRYTITVTTDSDTAFMELQPIVVGNTGAADLIMDAWFDDITFRRT